MGFHTLTLFRSNDKINGKRTDGKHFVKMFERFEQKNLTDNHKYFNVFENVFKKPFERH